VYIEDERAVLVDLVEEIAAAVLDTPPQLCSWDPSPEARVNLAGGDAGVAVMCDHLARAGLTRRDYRAESRRHLESAVAGAVDDRLAIGLHDGLAGIAWALEHLNGQVFDSDEDDLGHEIDCAFLKRLAAPSWDAPYDLLSGLTGIGVYALERLPRPSAREVLQAVVRHLDEMAVVDDHGVALLTRPHLLSHDHVKAYPNGYYNFGVAHGMSGVASLLASVSAAGIDDDRASTLLEGVITWIWRHAQPAEVGSAFPDIHVPGDSPSRSRCGWCHGDPGMAGALLACAQANGRSDWAERATILARGAAVRPFALTGVVDPGLCHGAAGLALIYARFFFATGDPLFSDATRFWVERMLEMRQPGRGLAGFLAYVGPTDESAGWSADRGLLSGAAGIALTLLAVASDHEPSWDRLFSLSHGHADA
jgi:hypothetical protein